MQHQHREILPSTPTGILHPKLICSELQAKQQGKDGLAAMMQGMSGEKQADKGPPEVAVVHAEGLILVGMAPCATDVSSSLCGCKGSALGRLSARAAIMSGSHHVIQATRTASCRTGQSLTA
jgi:hypothetical protein